MSSKKGTLQLAHKISLEESTKRNQIQDNCLDLSQLMVLPFDLLRLLAEGSQLAWGYPEE
jgi:hypothetical protein